MKPPVGVTLSTEVPEPPGASVMDAGAKVSATGDVTMSATAAEVEAV